MAAPKKKPKLVQASEVVVDNRRLTGVLADYDERIKAAEARSAEARALYDARHAEYVALRTANEARHAAIKEQLEALMRAMAAGHKDFVAFVQEMREDRKRVDARLGRLETVTGLAAE